MTTPNGVFEGATATQSITLTLNSQTLSGFPVIPDQPFRAPTFTITKPTASSGVAGGGDGVVGPGDDQQ